MTAGRCRDNGRMKARLTSGQVVAAVVAGAVGHILFASAWSLLWLALAGGAVRGILGVTAEGLADRVSGESLGGLFDSAGGILGGIVIVIAIGGALGVVVAVLVSAGILAGGKVRRPWATTFTSLLIAAVLSGPLALVYWLVSRPGEGGLPFLLVAGLGTIIVGVLIWLWMAWAHRGPANVE